MKRAITHNYCWDIPCCFNSFNRYIRWVHWDNMLRTCISILKLDWKRTLSNLLESSCSILSIAGGRWQQRDDPGSGKRSAQVCYVFTQNSERAPPVHRARPHTACAKANNLTLNRHKSKEIIVTPSRRSMRAINQPSWLPGIERFTSLKILGVTMYRLAHYFATLRGE